MLILEGSDLSIMKPATMKPCFKAGAVYGDTRKDVPWRSLEFRRTEIHRWEMKQLRVLGWQQKTRYRCVRSFL